MTNYEQNKKWFDENMIHLLSGLRFAVGKSGKPCFCNYLSCYDCMFNNSQDSCDECRRKWLNTKIF